MPVSIIASVSVIVGFLLLAFGFCIRWRRKKEANLSDIIELTIYSFISGGSVGLFISATYYVFTGEIFPSESMQSLITILEIGAIVLLLGSFLAYVKKLRS